MPAVVSPEAAPTSVEAEKQPIPSPDFYTPAQLGARWQVCPQTIKREVKRGRLRRVVVGRAVRFAAVEVARYEGRTEGEAG